MVPRLTRPTVRRSTRYAVWFLALTLALLTAGGLAAGCRKAPPPLPQTPEELVTSIFGVPREGSEDPGVYATELTPAGEFAVNCRYVMMAGGMRGCQERLIQLFSDVFRFENVTSVYVEMIFPFRDKAGKITLEKGLTVRLTRATAATVDWANLKPGDLPTTCTEWWQDPRAGK
jgi:hypothetical protein